MNSSQNPASAGQYAWYLEKGPVWRFLCQEPAGLAYAYSTWFSQNLFDSPNEAVEDLLEALETSSIHPLDLDIEKSWIFPHIVKIANSESWETLCRNYLADLEKAKKEKTEHPVDVTYRYLASLEEIESETLTEDINEFIRNLYAVFKAQSKNGSIRLKYRNKYNNPAVTTGSIFRNFVGPAPWDSESDDAPQGNEMI